MTAATEGKVVALGERSVVRDLAHRYGMEQKPFQEVILATCFPDKERPPTPAEFAAFLVVANEYELNPLTKEIYAFRTRGGGIQPIVSIDGWCSLINRQKPLDGIEFDDHLTGEKLTAVTARIWRKDRAKPIVVTEYMAECLRDTSTWKQWPRRMLRHKALIQCARYAFGLSGIVDPDEAERMGVDVSPMRDVSPNRDAAPPGPPPEPEEATQPVERDVIDLAATARDPTPVEWTDPETGEIHEKASAEAKPEYEYVGNPPGSPIQAEKPGPTVAFKMTGPSGLKPKAEAPQQGERWPGVSAEEADWLRDLDGALGGVEDDLALLAEQQMRVMAPKRNQVARVAWAHAERLVQEHLARVKG